MATKVTLETLALDVAYIKETITEIKSGVVPRNEIELRITELKAAVTEANLKIADLYRRIDKRFRWEVIGSNILTATLVSLLSVLITYFVTNIGK